MEENKTSFSIKQWAEEDRPREKLLLKGKASLSDAELVAILIASGNNTESAVDLSKRILDSVQNNLIELSKLSVNDLKQFKGIGEAKAITIIAGMELGKRRQKSDTPEKVQIKSPKDSYNFIQAHLSDLQHEEFFVLFLNRANRIIHFQTISVGGISGTVVDVRIILKLALEKLATSIILAHNHPSGNIQPSHEDIKLTQKLKLAASHMEITVQDHLIVGENKYYSFAEEAMI